MDVTSRHAPAEEPGLPGNTSATDSAIIPLVGYYVYSIIMFVLGCSLTSAVALFGVFSNIANITVYYSMGLHETTSINFFTLAISDLIVSVATIVVEMTLNPQTMVTLPAGALTLQSGFAASFIVYSCSGLSAWITTLLSIERCLCIIFPLKVKMIVTTKRMTIVTSAMAVYQFCFLVINFLRTGPPYDSLSPERVLYMLCMSTIPTAVCFPIITISTSFLTIRLKQTIKWRQTSMDRSRSDSHKERKAARSVIFICSMFIICFLPNVLILFASAVHGNLSLFDPYLRWLLNILYVFSFLFQTLNSSLNIFVYYFMSSRFSVVFRDVFMSKKHK